MDAQLALPNELGFTFPTRVQILEKFATLRQEWEDAANGQSLVEIDSSVGFILADITIKLGLTAEEQYIVLGVSLYNDLAIIHEDQSAH